MRAAGCLAFCLILSAGVGCAITDYGVITDNDQSKAGAGNAGNVVNTAGKAHIIEKSQILTIWSDGTDDTFSFVDQKADGTATLTTYNNFSTGSEPQFHSDLYCNTSWMGCAIWTNIDENDDQLFDGDYNPNCSGARSTCILLSTSRYYGECGRQRARLDVRQKLGLLNGAVEATAFGRRGLNWTLDERSVRIRARNLDTGAVVGIPLYGASADLFHSNGDNLTFVWLDHAMLGTAIRDMANRLDGELKGDALEVTITYNGVPVSFTVAGGAHPVANSSLWRYRANRSF